MSIKNLNIRDTVRKLTTEGMNALSNSEFAKFDNTFRNKCKAADIPATKRQASKYRMKRGFAFKGFK